MNEEILKNLGPLGSLGGIWEGNTGDDAAPAADRKKVINQFRERMVFEPRGPVSNHEQKLYGYRYSTQAFRPAENDPFHDEVGYWLWDPVLKQLIKSITIPRGMVILAGGPAEADAKSFKLKAELGSRTYGICSNPFLDLEFQTVKYEIEMKFNADGSFTYDQCTFLKIKGQEKIFEHRDINSLRKVSPAK